MGFEIKRFESDVDENLICQICCKVYDNPKSLSSCEHTFCFGCLEKSVINENVCPLDQKPIESSHIEEAPKAITEYLSYLRIRCDFEEYGCKEVVPLHRLLLHRINCEFHPERKVRCSQCESEMEKSRLRDHNCIAILKNRLDVMNERMNELKNSYTKELSSLRTQLQRWDYYRLTYARECAESGAGERQVIPFSCVGDTQSGAHEIIFIQTTHLTLRCETSMLTKIGQIKYNASSIINHNTTDFSLFYNGKRLEDDNSIAYYSIHNRSICHLLPNEVYIKFDCIDIKQILSFSVRTCDTISAIIGQLNREIQKVIPDKLFQYLKQCSCCLYFGDTKLEETYELSNYDVLAIQTLKYCNRLYINV